MEKPIFVIDATVLNGMTDAQRSEKLFSNTYRHVGSLTEYARNNPAEYQRARQLTQLKPSSKQEGEAIRAEWTKQAAPRQYSQAELHARGIWTESAALEALNKRNLVQMKAENALGYAELMLALASYGHSGKSVAEAEAKVSELSRPPEPVKTEEVYTLWPELAQAVGLPVGTRVNKQTFDNAIKASVQLSEEKKKAEKTKAETTQPAVAVAE